MTNWNNVLCNDVNHQEQVNTKCSDLIEVYLRAGKVAFQSLGSQIHTGRKKPLM